MTLMCFGPLWVPKNYFSGCQMTSTRCHAYFVAAYIQDIQQSLQQLLWCGGLHQCSFHGWMILRQPKTLRTKIGNN
jgi:hypothetical protein